MTFTIDDAAENGPKVRSFEIGQHFGVIAHEFTDIRARCLIGTLAAGIESAVDGARAYRTSIETVHALDALGTASPAIDLIREYGHVVHL